MNRSSFVRRAASRPRRACALIVLSAISVTAAQAQVPDFRPNNPVAPDQTNALEPLLTQIEGQQESPVATAYRRAFYDQRFDEAVYLGKQLVAEMISTHGRDSLIVGQSLNNLALAQFRARDFDAAQENFRAAIAIIESQEDRLSSNLIVPLRGLGRSEFESGNAAESIDKFERAVHLMQVNSGPLNLEQIEVLRSLSAAYLTINDMSEAESIEKMSLQLFQRRFTKDDPELIPHLYRRAEWLLLTERYLESVTMYDRIARLIKGMNGSESLAMIPALQGSGYANFLLYASLGAPTDTVMANLRAKSVQKYRRAMRIAEKSPDASILMRADTQIAYADFLNYSFENHSTAARNYREAWTDLSSDENLIDAREERFSKPQMLSEINLPQYIDRNGKELRSPGRLARELKDGFISIGYRISRFGLVKKATVLESEPAGLIDDKVLRRVRNLVFRPRVIDGKPVGTEGNLFRHEFKYVPTGTTVDESNESAADGANEAPDAASTETADEAPAGTTMPSADEPVIGDEQPGPPAMDAEPDADADADDEAPARLPQELETLAADDSDTSLGQ